VLPPIEGGVRGRGWLRSLLSDLGFPQQLLTVIFEDNQPTIDLSSNPGEHRHSKHIDVQFHFTRKKVESGEVDIYHTSTRTQMADIMTKASIRNLFSTVKEALLHPF
jgi:hypothetical protein